MKKTLALMVITVFCSAAGSAVGATSPVTPSSGTSHSSGAATTTEGVALGKDMVFGTLNGGALGNGAIPHGGNLYAGNYTLSLWLDPSGVVLPGSNTTLFGYYGASAGGDLGANGLYLSSEGKLGMGAGKLVTGTGVFTLTGQAARKDITDQAISLSGGLLNITLSVKGANGKQQVAVYINGALFDNLSYNGNMNGSQNTLGSWINPDLTWGEVSWTDSALEADQIAGFADLQVPEPAAASLGILGLAVLMVRRRRS